MERLSRAIGKLVARVVEKLLPVSKRIGVNGMASQAAGALDSRDEVVCNAAMKLHVDSLTQIQQERTLRSSVSAESGH